MEHLDLFSDGAGQAPPNSKAARAVAALDALLQDLAVPEEVQLHPHAQRRFGRRGRERGETGVWEWGAGGFGRRIEGIWPRESGMRAQAG